MRHVLSRRPGAQAPTDSGARVRVWRASAVALLALPWLLFAPRAAAFSVSLTGGGSGQVVRWPTSALTYSLHPACSADLPAAACLDEVRASFAAWTGQACSAIQFTEGAPSSNLKLTSVGYDTNGINELAWIENSQWTYGTYVLGVTSPVFYNDGTIIEADIAFNGYLQTWSMSGADYSTDVKSVAVHEIGHFFGLQHVLGGYDSGNPPTMAPTADPFMQSRTPEADDLKGLCFLVPKGAYTCSSDADCPHIVAVSQGQEYYAGILSCTNGSCGDVSNQIPQGTGALGDTCTNDYDCADPGFCQSLSTGSGVCGSPCAPASDTCPAGFSCVAYSNAPDQGVCLADQGGSTGPKAAAGEPCQYSTDCQSLLCVQDSSGSFCRDKCSADGDCSGGQSCMPLSGQSYGACLDASTPPPTGDGAISDPCTSGADCASGLCAGDGTAYVCTQRCDASSPCPTGYDCFGFTDGSGGGCFPAAGQAPVGAPCQYSNDCASGSCVAFEGGGDPFCTAPCQGDADCPCGTTCTATTTDSICAPGPKVGCVPEGAACAADGECSSGLCTGGVCAAACSIYQPATCGAGGGCARVEPGAPDGICTGPGPASDGKPCADDAACQSLLCHEGLCARPCNPYAGTAPGAACAADEACAVAAGTVGVCAAAPPQGQPDAGSSSGPDSGGAGGAGDAGGAQGDTVGAADVSPGPTPFPGGSGGGGGCSAGASWHGSDHGSSPGSSHKSGRAGLALALLMGLAWVVRSRR